MYVEYHKMAIVMACFNDYAIPNLLVATLAQGLLAQEWLALFSTKAQRLAPGPVFFAVLAPRIAWYPC